MIYFILYIKYELFIWSLNVSFIQVLSNISTVPQKQKSEVEFWDMLRKLHIYSVQIVYQLFHSY